MEKIVIAGGGPAGLSAAIYAARAGVSPLVLEGVAPGGQLAQAGRIDNYPGFPDGIGGAELAAAMRAQAGRLGARFRFGEELASFQVAAGGAVAAAVTDGGDIVETAAIVAATGTAPRRLGLDSERRLAGRGVSYCATCDGAFFRGRAVAVAGIGAPALRAALYLAPLCASVTVVPVGGGTPPRTLLAQARALPNVRFEDGAARIEELREGDGRRLRAAVVRDAAGAAREIPCDGLFVELGAEPSVAWAGDRVPREADGRLRVAARGATGVPGLFAAGDAVEPFLRQVCTAVASGAVAATAALRYLRARTP
ncbi:MAG: FAD-dependent oxidoreductase [Kiritimatiellae bacterium]|nr:FAD-dependent oxidoreductase [Kiritimatiellia bacterium]